MERIKISGLMLLMLSFVFAFASCGGDDEEMDNELPDSGVSAKHEYVDLGLPSGIKWATCNVGAFNPEDYGDYFAWGETQPKLSYYEENSNTYGKKMSDFSGNSQYDAATANWGGAWRMPTKSEIDELKGNCIFKFTLRNDVKGLLVTGPNGNSIFLPAAGARYGTKVSDTGDFCNYWSSTPDEDNDCYAYMFGNTEHGELDLHCYERTDGQSVRPVSD